ncbi:Mirror-image polydactyly gene 1 protein [Trichoplax sp. H2]|nr:Mirror-image polydactyly gene 1 protein [Trichoplax sp. H2]|eukprot:RDD42620.1 Mirror-image polydactyly gene 1 protein [Trichoplax sp. H2]
MPSPELQTAQNLPSNHTNTIYTNNEKGDTMQKSYMESIHPTSPVGQMAPAEAFINNTPTYIPTMVQQFPQPAITQPFSQPILQPLVQPVLHAIHQPMHQPISTSTVGPLNPSQSIPVQSNNSVESAFRYFPPMNSNNIPVPDIGSQVNLFQANSNVPDNLGTMPPFIPPLRNRSPSESVLSDNYSLGSSYNYGSQRLFGATSPTFSFKNGDLKLDYTKSSDSPGRYGLSPEAPVLSAREMMSEEINAKVAQESAALVERLYKAQKERDCAIMARLRHANEERDAAVKKLRQIESTRSTSSFYGSDDESESESEESEDEKPVSARSQQDVSELLTQINRASSIAELNRHGAQVIGKVKSVQKQKHVTINHELTAALKEKDEAVNKCSILEEDVRHLHREKESLKSKISILEDTKVKSLRSQLIASQEERDSLLRRLKRSEEELEDLRIYYSLHNSLSDEKNLRDQFNATIQAYEDKLRQYETSNRQLDQDNQELNSKLNNIIRERDEKARQLHEATTSKFLAEQKAEK